MVPRAMQTQRAKTSLIPRMKASVCNCSRSWSSEPPLSRKRATAGASPVRRLPVWLKYRSSRCRMSSRNRALPAMGVEMRETWI